MSTLGAFDSFSEGSRFESNEILLSERFLTKREKFEKFISDILVGGGNSSEEFTPMSDMVKHQYNDPSPIQIRGGDNVLIQALQLKDAEMRRFQEFSQERFIEGSRKKY